jgi:hypothetical protein
MAAHIQYDHVEVLLLKGAQSLPPAAHSRGIDLAAFEPFHDGFEKILLIVHNQNPELFHNSSP